jgi:hypothetical protein
LHEHCSHPKVTGICLHLKLLREIGQSQYMGLY